MTTPHPRRASLPSASGTAVAPTATATGPPQERRRYRQLDNYRGLAVIASVVFNVYQFCNVNDALYHRGFIYRVVNSFDAAVPCLFVIAGFLLFEPVARQAIDGGPSGSAGSFLARRAARLVPLYYLAVVVVWFFRQRRLPGDWRDLLEHLSFTQVFDAKRIFYTNGPAWAVSVLVFFYLILALVGPVISRISRRSLTRGGRIVVVCAVPAILAVVSVVWKAWSFGEQHRSTTGSSTTWYGPIANLDNVAAGMAVAAIAIALGNSHPAPARVRVGLRVAAVAILAAAVMTRTGDTWPSLYFTTICSVGFGCLTAAAVFKPTTKQAPEHAQWRLVTWLGIISYGIYLWHEPILLALNGWAGLVRQSPDAFLQDSTVVLTISIAAGGLSYLLIQRPADQLLKIFGPSSRPEANPSDRPDRPSSDGDDPRPSPVKQKPTARDTRHLTLLPSQRQAPPSPNDSPRASRAQYFSALPSTGVSLIRRLLRRSGFYAASDGRR